MFDKMAKVKGKMSSDERNTYTGVGWTLQMVWKYILTRFAFIDALLKNAVVVDIDKRKSVKFENLQYFAERFHAC